MNYDGKTLAILLCMHRSGSSLTTNIFSELGMSLGPFTMIGPRSDNPHGFFETHEFCELNRAVQNHALGFGDDVPLSRETLQRFVECEGCWPDGVDLPPQWLDRGEELVRRLVASGPVSGFKDPRVPLAWPFWAEVMRRFPGLRVVPTVLLRSPHEIATSIFMRSEGRFDYCDVLDITAAHFKRIRAILADWRGPVARVRFLPEYFSEDLCGACRLLGLAWSEEAQSRVFDVDCKHYTSAIVAHPAQALFEQLAALPAQEFSRENAAHIETDAAARQHVLRRNLTDAKSELASTQATLASVRGELSTAEAEAKRLTAELSATQAEAKRMATELSAAEAGAKRLAAELSAAQAEAKRLAADLRMIKTSRFWRLRELLVTFPGLKQLANRPLPVATIPLRTANGPTDPGFPSRGEARAS